VLNLLFGNPASQRLRLVGVEPINGTADPSAFGSAPTWSFVTDPTHFKVGSQERNVGEFHEGVWPSGAKVGECGVVQQANPDAHFGDIV
jgi:hypothetical protein